MDGKPAFAGAKHAMVSISRAKYPDTILSDADFLLTTPQYSNLGSEKFSLIGGNSRNFPRILKSRFFIAVLEWLGGLDFATQIQPNAKNAMLRWRGGSPATAYFGPVLHLGHSRQGSGLVLIRV